MEGGGGGERVGKKNGGVKYEDGPGEPYLAVAFAVDTAGVLGW